QATRPQTIGYALLDSPIALAAWMIDHDTDSYQKIARAFTGGQPSGNLTREHIVDNITLYWLTTTRAPPPRSYCDECQQNTGPHAGLASGRLHDVPWGDLADPAQLGREGVPQRHLLQRGGQGRSLRRLGGTGALFAGVARRLPPAALAETRELGVTCTTGDGR